MNNIDAIAPKLSDLLTVDDRDCFRIATEGDAPTIQIVTSEVTIWTDTAMWDSEANAFTYVADGWETLGGVRGFRNDRPTLSDLAAAVADMSAYGAAHHGHVVTFSLVWVYEDDQSDSEVSTPIGWTVLGTVD